MKFQYSCCEGTYLQSVTNDLRLCWTESVLVWQFFTAGLATTATFCFLGGGPIIFFDLASVKVWSFFSLERSYQTGLIFFFILLFWFIAQQSASLMLLIFVNWVIASKMSSMSFFSLSLGSSSFSPPDPHPPSLLYSSLSDSSLGI